MTSSIHRLRLALLVLCLSSISFYTSAGQPCAEKPATETGRLKAAQLSTQVRDHLENQKLSFALVGRAGIDLTEFGLVHSHVGVAWRDHPRGRWYTFHLLNRCGTGQSELVEQSLEDFYNVELFDYDALVAAPSFPVQLRLQRAFFSPLATQLHEREYNLIAHPFVTKFQNSNQWALEVIAAALAPSDSVNSRAAAQDWLKQEKFVPSLLAIGAARRAGARLFSPHVRFSDHTEAERMAQRYAIVSVRSVVDFLKSKDSGLIETRIQLPKHQTDNTGK
jgi:hypothetical protein